jgi:hypothetical protein
MCIVDDTICQYSHAPNASNNVIWHYTSIVTKQLKNTNLFCCYWRKKEYYYEETKLLK